MKKVTLFLIAVLFLSASLMAGPKKPLGIKQIPQTAQTFLASHFANLSFDSGYLEGGDKTTYTIKYTDGTEVEFDENGQWREIECPVQIPDAVIPAKILQYVKAKYSNTKIIKIEKKRNGFEIELSNDVELVFNTNGDFVKVD